MNSASHSPFWKLLQLSIKQMLFGSREEKEQYIIELYKQGKTIRQIAQEVHMAFGPICPVIRKFNGENEQNNKQEKLNPPSKDTQAFKLFSEGKKPVDVKIELDMAAAVTK